MMSIGSPKSHRLPLRRLLHPLAATALLGAVVGCADLFGPREVAGTYVLERLAGRPLPTLIWLTQTHRWTLLADTLTLHADDSGLIRGILRRQSLSDNSDHTVVINNLPVVLEVRAGGELWLRETSGCPDGSACAPLEFRFDWRGAEATLLRTEGLARYRRVGRAP